MNKNVAFLSISTACMMLFGTVQNVEAKSNKADALYSIEIDSFYNGNNENDGTLNFDQPNSYRGGDLVGVGKRLTHPEGIGFRNIRISPLFLTGFEGAPKLTKLEEGRSPDPHLATAEEVTSFLNTAHKRQLNVILDIPDLSSYPVEDQVTLLTYYLNVGFDGLYFYDADKQSAKTWDYILTKLNRSYPERRLIAEFPSDSIEKAYTDLPWTNYSTTTLQNALIQSLGMPDQSLQPIVSMFKTGALDERMLGSMDSRLSQRFVTEAIQNKTYPGSRLELALTALFTAPTTPNVLYGSEIGLEGEDGEATHTLMNFQTQSEMIEHMQRLVKIRNTVPALRYGDFELISEKNGLLLYKRTYKDQHAFVAINNTSKDQKLKLSSSEVPSKKELNGLLVDDLVRYEKDGYYLVLKRETSNIYVVSDETSIRWDRILITLLIPVGFVAFLYTVKRRKKQE
ncbi:MAG: hypothetical protein ACRCWQ_10520 [Bacilli bacterium]